MPCLKTPGRCPPKETGLSSTLHRLRALNLLGLMGLMGLLSLLLGCAAAPRAGLLHLPATPPSALAGTAVSGSAHAVSSPAADSWLIQYPVRLPDYLDHDALLLRQGAAGLQRLPGHRWAEPLREAVPRLLRADLARLLGEARVWTVPLPAGMQPARQLRLEVLAFEADAEQRQVQLQARWSLARADASTPPVAQAVTLQVPVAGGSADALAAAYRSALWQLAQRVVATADGR
jgi:uncharacterized lipoprotein YmbA